MRLEPIHPTLQAAIADLDNGAGNLKSFKARRCLSTITCPFVFEGEKRKVDAEQKKEAAEKKKKEAEEADQQWLQDWFEFKSSTNRGLSGVGRWR